MYSYTKPSYLDSYQQRSKHSTRSPFPDVNTSQNNSYTPSYHQAASDVRQQMKIQEIMQKHSRDQQRLLQLMNENSYLRKNREDKIQRTSEKTKAEADYILSLRRDNKRYAYLKYLHGQNDHQIVENLYSHPSEKPRSRLSSMDQRHYVISGSPQQGPRDLNYSNSQYYTEGSPRNNGVKMYRSVVKGVRVYETNLMQYEAPRPQRQNSSYNKDYSWDARAHTTPQEEEDEDDIAIKMWIDGTQPYYTQEDEGLNYQRDEYMSHHGSQRGSMRGSGRTYGRDLPAIGSRKGGYGGKDSPVMEQYMDPRTMNGARRNNNNHRDYRDDDQDYILDEDVKGNRSYPYPPQHQKQMRKPSLNVSFETRNQGYQGNQGYGRPRASSNERNNNISFESEMSIRDRNHYMSTQNSSGRRSHGSRQDHNDSAVIDPAPRYHSQPRGYVRVPKEKSPSHLNVPHLTHNLSFGAPKDGDSDHFEDGHENLRSSPQQQTRPNGHMIYSHINKKSAEQKNSPQLVQQQPPQRKPAVPTQNRANVGRGRSISGPTPEPTGLEKKSLGQRQTSQNSGDLLKQLQVSKDGFVSIQLDQFRDLDQTSVSPRFRTEGGSRESQNNNQVPKVVVYDTDTKKTLNMDFLKPVKPTGKNRRSESVKGEGSRVQGGFGNSPLLMRPLDKIMLEKKPITVERGNRILEDEAVDRALREDLSKEKIAVEKAIEEKKTEEKRKEIRENKMEGKPEEIKKKESQKVIEKVGEQKDKIEEKHEDIKEKKRVEEKQEEIVKEKERQEIVEKMKEDKKLREELNEEVKEKKPEEVVEKVNEDKIVTVKEVEIVEAGNVKEEIVEGKVSEAAREEKVKDEKRILEEKSKEKSLQKIDGKVEEKLSEKKKEEKISIEKNPENVPAGKQDERVVEKVSEKKQDIEPEDVCEEILNDELEEELIEVEENVIQESVPQEILEEIKSERVAEVKPENNEVQKKEAKKQEEPLEIKNKPSEKATEKNQEKAKEVQKSEETIEMKKNLSEKATEAKQEKSLEKTKEAQQSNETSVLKKKPSEKIVEIKHEKAEDKTEIVQQPEAAIQIKKKPSEKIVEVKHEKGQEETKDQYKTEDIPPVKKKASEELFAEKVAQQEEPQNKFEKTLPKKDSVKVVPPESMKSTIEDGDQSNLSVTSLNLKDKVQSPLKPESSARKSPHIPKLQSLDKIQVASKIQAKVKPANAQESSRNDLVKNLNNVPNEYPQANPSENKSIKPVEPTKKTEPQDKKEVYKEEKKGASKETSPLIVSGSPLNFTSKVEEPEENLFDYLEDVDNNNNSHAGENMKSSLSESLSRQTLRVPILEEGGDHNDVQSDSTIQGLLGMTIEKKV